MMNKNFELSLETCNEWLACLEKSKAEKESKGDYSSEQYFGHEIAKAKREIKWLETAIAMQTEIKALREELAQLKA